MHRNIRRALYTACVAGGLMVVAASAAHAAGERLPDPATQAVTDTIEGSAATRGDLDAAADLRELEAGAAAGAEGVVGDIVGPKGILGSLANGDVGGVVDGALGEDGLVDDLVGGLPPTEAPGPEDPGTDGPGTDEPGTDEPGTDPGTDGPGPGGPGIEPGIDEPGIDEPGTDEPGTDEPGTDEPGTDEPGTDGPGTGKPGTSKPGTSKPGTGRPAADGGDPGVGTDRPATNPPGTGSTTVGPGHGYYGTERPAGVTLIDAIPDGPRTSGTDGQDDADASAAGSDADRELPGGGIDIRWGDNGDVVPETTYDGSILSGDGLTTGLTGTVPEPDSEPEGEAVAKPVVGPGDANPFARTGHMFTGQLSLISLLLGLGIAVLRTRRR